MQISELVGRFLDRPIARGVLLATFGVLAVIPLRVRSPLSWDEAVYAARGKDLAETNFDFGVVTGSYWSDLRAPGLPGFLATAFEVFGASDFIARLVAVAFSVGLLWLLAKTLDLVAAPRAGTTAVLIAGACPGVLATSTLAFADHPGAFFAVAGVYFLLHSYVHGPGLRLVMVPLSIGMATTVRFGSGMFVAAAFVVIAIAVIAQALRERDARSLVPYIGSGVMTGAIGLFLLGSTFLTVQDSPLDATDAQVESLGHSSTKWLTDLQTILTPGPVDYGFNGPFWGWSYASIFVLLVVAVVTKLLVRGQFLWLAVFTFIALSPVVLYGISVGQFVTNYLSPQFAIASAVLGWALWLPARNSEAEADPAGVLEADPVELSGLLRAGVLCGVLVLSYVTARSFQGVEAMHERLTGFEQVRLASMAADDMLGSNCRLYTARVPQVSWYSDCVTYGFAGSFRPDGETVGDGLPWDEFISTQANRGGVGDGATLGFLILEGASGQARMDDVWSSAEPDNSLILSSPAGRRVALFEVSTSDSELVGDTAGG